MAGFAYQVASFDFSFCFYGGAAASLVFASLYGTIASPASSGIAMTRSEPSSDWHWRDAEAQPLLEPKNTVGAGRKG